MIFRLKRILNQYPRQFWIVTLVMMLAYTFHSMLWSYLIIYVSEIVNQPLTAVTGLLTLNSLVGMATTFLGGAVADKFGRKWVSAISLLFCGLSWFLFQYAHTISVFALLMALNGATTPLYRLASDAMMADVVPPEKRIDAYSILRLGNNLGVALGPSIGGFLSAISYSISFTTTGIGFLIITLIVVLFSIETKPEIGLSKQPSGNLGGYKAIAQDRKFMGLVGSYTLCRVCSSILWLLLAVYAKQNFGISERVYGFIPTTNAVMVILFQVVVTSKVKLHSPEKMMTLGAALYAIGVFAVAFGHGFWMFWLCMVIATIGEMILLPISTTYASLLAPEDMRGRYMSIYTLTTGVGQGIGPLIGGLMNDSLGPQYIWYTGGLIGGFGALAFWINSRRVMKTQQA